MIWGLSHRFDPSSAKIADRHYSRQKTGTNQFSPPGRLCVLRIDNSALWGVVHQEAIDHQWKNSWNNFIFRNEGAGLSSELILQAVAATRYSLGDPPEGGLITFINRGKVRKKRDFGRCYRKAGFIVVGETKIRKHLVLQLEPDKFPEMDLPIGAQHMLF